MALCTPDPILRFTDGTRIVDILAPGSGWKLVDPYWRPQIAQYKAGGPKINPSIAPGQRLVHKEYDNVIETFPLEAVGVDEEACIATINELLSLSRQSADYWAESYEFDDVWIEAKTAGVDSLTGYAQVIQMRIAELGNVFGQPFFSPYKESIMDGLTLTVEREPLWRAVPPGEIIGPLYNLIRNPDFELWNSGIVDSQPDSWTDLETIQITGDNSRQSTAVHSGNYALKVHVGGSTLTGRIKGVTQTLSGIKAQTEYTVIAWVRSDGVSNGVGRILVTYSGQLEVYRESARHGWTLYTGRLTTGDSDTVGINCEILTTAANTDGTVYFDSLMLLEGDWEQFAIDGVLPYITSSHIVNHWDQDTGVIEAGDINYVDVYNVPGTDDSLVRLDFKNFTTPSATPVERFGKVRIGMRRTGDVFNFQNYYDPAGPVDTSASGDNRVETGTLNEDFRTFASFQLSDATLIEALLGRFRAFGRFYDSTGAGQAPEVQLSYFVGSSSQQKTFPAGTLPVRQNWCIVDLTPTSAINWDFKLKTIRPGLVGYNIAARRGGGSGTATIYLDTIQLLPTDGGFAIVELAEPLPYLASVILDGTGPEVTAGAISSDLSGWRTDFNASDNLLSVFMAYSGQLYCGGRDDVLGEVRLWRRNLDSSGGWTRMQKFPTARRILSMAVYNGLLYAGTETTLNGASAVYSSPDGETWTLSLATTRPVNSLVAYGGYLFALTGAAGAGAAGEVQRYNGTSWSVIRSLAGGFANGIGFNGELFAPVRTGTNVHRYNLTSGIWTIDTLSASGPFHKFGEFNGSLFLGQAASGDYYQYDTQTWTLRNFTPSVTTPSWLKFLSFNGQLYGAIHSSVYVSDNGIDWTLSTPSPDTTSPNLADLYPFNNELYFCENSDGLIRANGAGTSLSPLASFVALPFRSPPQKRHRFFFSFDRGDGTNVAADAALVGIGFVPRYLGLRGKG